MSEDKVPLCDRHYLRMRPKDSSLSSTLIFKCASPSCDRHYGKRYGYFNLLAVAPSSKEQIDPADRGMKLCSTKRHAQSYMAITRPKNTGPGARNLWCWFCYACAPAKG